MVRVGASEGHFSVDTSWRSLDQEFSVDENNFIDKVILILWYSVCRSVFSCTNNVYSSPFVLLQELRITSQELVIDLLLMTMLLSNNSICKALIEPYQVSSC